MNTTTTTLGKFIVLAGCEGAGKTTQMENLKRKYPDAIFFREPGGTEFSEKGPRHLMLTSIYSSDLSPYTQMSLAFAGRGHNIEKIIGPALREGKIVFADRFDSCSFAYQIYGMEGGMHLRGLFELQRRDMGPEEYLPVLYIILDISPEEGMKRVAKREFEKKGTSNHFDKRGLEFHARVREGYRQFAELYPTKVVIVDGHPSKDQVWQQIEQALSKVL